MFELDRRKGTFKFPNIREEKHGDEVKVAFDLPVEVTVFKKDLANLLPVDEDVKSGSLLDDWWDKDGAFMTAYITTLPLARKPEGLKVLIIDQPKNPGKPKANPTTNEAVILDDVTIKGPVLCEFDSRHTATLKFKIQASDVPDDIVTRVTHLSGEARFFELTQPQMDPLS